MNKNLMLPEQAIIRKIEEENKSTRTFTLQFRKKALRNNFTFLPGKFVEVSVFGYGEIPLCIASSPYRKESFDVTVMDVGNVSRAMHRLNEGAVVGVRGPFGRGFPLNRFRNYNFALVSGGSGFVPIHSLASAILQKREFFGQLFIFCGARSPEIMCYKKDMREWEKCCKLFASVERPGKKWKGHKGLVTDLIDKAGFPLKKTAAVLCGPQAMMDAASEKLRNKGIAEEEIFMFLERKMQCGIGGCAHCNINHKYVCIDGPLFSLKEFRELEKED